MAPKAKNIQLQLPANEEETIYIFPLEDLVKEHNNKSIIRPFSTRNNQLTGNSINLNTSSIGPAIRGVDEDMTVGPYEVTDAHALNKALKKQTEPKGIAKNAKNFAKLAMIAGMIEEIGLRGKVYYKTVNGKTYVILKGNPAQRAVLKGTRYLNTNPQITQLGLAKVNVKSVFVKGFKISFLVYGALKAIEAVEIILNDDEFKPSFFTEAGTAIPKIAVSSLFTAAAAGIVATTALPVAIGMGLVLIAGIGFGIAVEYFDQKFELTKKLNEAADKMWENLKADPNVTNNQKKPGTICNPLLGLPCGVPYASYKKMIQSDKQIIYTA